MPHLNLKIEVTDDEATQIKKWQAQGLVEGDDELLDSLLLLRQQKSRSIIESKNRRAFVPRILESSLLSCGLLVLIVMLLFPPFRHVGYYSGSGRLGGYNASTTNTHGEYGFILNPDKRLYLLPDDKYWYVPARCSNERIDFLQLSVQCLVVVLVFGGAYLIIRRLRT